MSIQEILFPNGYRAQLAAVPVGAPAAGAVKTLKLPQAHALIMLFGGAEELEDALNPRLLQMFSRGLVPAAVRAGAMIMDGGTHSGAMACMGAAVAEGERQVTLLGVAPTVKVTYPGDKTAAGNAGERTPLDPNHTHFVLVEGSEWGCETEAMFEIADSLTGPQTPVIAVLVDGGPHTLPELLRCVRQGWSLVILTGTGRLADELAHYTTAKTESIDDRALAEIIADGDLTLFPLNGPVEQFQNLLERKLSLDPTLKLAWDRYALYNANAQRKQRRFRRIQLGVLALGLLATVLPLVKQQWFPQPASESDYLSPSRIFHLLLIIIPITTASLVAMMNRFRWGQQWILLRNAAEAVNCMFYRYWTGTGPYRQLKPGEPSRQVKLAQELKHINEQLLQTEVNLSALPSPSRPFPFKFAGLGTGPDGYSLLSPGQYLSLRLEDQSAYYSAKAISLEKKLNRLNWLIYGFGGLGTLLAAIHQDLWVAATAAVITAITAYLAFNQVENILKAHNQAAAGLADLKIKWTAASPMEKSDPQQFDQLVEETEMILQGEHSAWVKQMKEALADLEKKKLEEQKEKDKKETAARPGKPLEDETPPPVPRAETPPPESPRSS
jgi:hypothetical protein